MALEHALEEGQSYASPTEFLEQVDQLPEDQSYWLENSTGRKETFGSLRQLRSYLDELEDDWQRFREFIPVESDSDGIMYRNSNQAEYPDVEFPYMDLETEHSSSVLGSINIGFMAEKDRPVQEAVPKASD
jgi:hypothetical protein